MNLAPQTDRTQRSEILGSAQADHELLFLGIENFRKLFAGVRPSDAAQQFASIQQLITKKIAEHFADEEDRIFPLLLAGNPTEKESQTIAELCEEHATFLATAQWLNALLQRTNLAKCKGELWTALRDFLTGLEKHIAKEDQLFEAFTCFVEIGNAQHALQVANTIGDDPYSTAQALRNIATTLVKTGDTKHAQAVFTRALQVTNALSNTLASMFWRPQFSHSNFHYAGTAQF